MKRLVVLLAVLLLTAPLANADIFDTINSATQQVTNAINQTVSVINTVANNSVNTTAPAAAVATGATTQVIQAVESAGAKALNLTLTAGQTALTTAANISESAYKSTQGVVNNVVGSVQGFAAQQAIRVVNVSDPLIGNATQALGGYASNLTTFVNTLTDRMRHPVVFWPGSGYSFLRLSLNRATVDPSCPSQGTIDITQQTLAAIPDNCTTSLLSLAYHPSNGSVGGRFSNAGGVTTSSPNFGSVTCAPAYSQLYAAFFLAGYKSNLDFYVACWDWRQSPDTNVGRDGIHLANAQRLVEVAYDRTGNRSVYLMSHSNGGIHALALLSRMSASWKAKYIAGFIPLAPTWTGRGVGVLELFQGSLSANGTADPAAAALYATWPSTYMQLADPAIYGNSEVLIKTLQSTGTAPARNYTAEDYYELFEDAGMDIAQELWPLFVGNITPISASPGTHFYGFYGTGLPTVTGVEMLDLEVGSPIGRNFTKNGDGVVDDTGSLAALVWKPPVNSCLAFSLTAVRGASHMGVTSVPGTLTSALDIVSKDPPGCPAYTQAAATAG